VDAAGYLHKRQIPTPKPMPEWARPIAQEVADRHGVTVEQLTGLSRLGRIAHARQAAYAALRSRGQVSLYQIGCWFGGRDHSTIRAGILRHEKRATADLEAWRALGKAKAA
jgi:chromosomal replication initiation ATPase DnaA